MMKFKGSSMIARKLVIAATLIEPTKFAMNSRSAASFWKTPRTVSAGNENPEPSLNGYRQPYRAPKSLSHPLCADRPGRGARVWDLRLSPDRGLDARRQPVCDSANLDYGRLWRHDAARRSWTSFCRHRYDAWRRRGCAGSLDHSSIHRSVRASAYVWAKKAYPKDVPASRSLYHLRLRAGRLASGARHPAQE